MSKQTNKQTQHPSISPFFCALHQFQNKTEPDKAMGLFSLVSISFTSHLSLSSLTHTHTHIISHTHRNYVACPCRNFVCLISDKKVSETKHRLILQNMFFLLLFKWFRWHAHKDNFEMLQSSKNTIIKNMFDWKSKITL